MSEQNRENRPFVDVVKVTKVYSPDIVALQDVSLSVDRGEMIFLTGMSGAGKSTLLKLISCMERPNKGLIEVAGRDTAKLKKGEIQELRQQIGMAYQDFKILPRHTVFQNVAMPMEVLYRPGREIKERVNEVLEALRMDHKKNLPAGKLSRGEQQRVAIARAAVNRPALILADEPTGNLDSEISTLVMKLFTELNEGGSTIIIATHDSSIYEGTSHRVVRLEHGMFTA